MKNNKKSTMAKQRMSMAEVLMTPEISMLIVLIVLCVYTNSVNQAFFAVKNIQIILRNCAFIGALAVGEAFALMCGEIDLSIGCNATLCSLVFAHASIILGWSPIASILAGLFTGIAVGLINAFITLKLGMTSWITTLSTQYICKGLGTIISKGGAIASLKGGFVTMSKARPLGLSWMLFIVIGIIFIMGMFMQFTPMGRKVHAVGISPEASRIAGLKVTYIKGLCMVFAGGMAAVCGILQTISSLSGSPVTGIGNEFPAIICCAIGGVSTTGGKGTMWGVFIGLLMYQTLKNCLQTLGLNGNYQMVVTGIVLLVAVAFDLVKKNFRFKRKKVA
ncbi:ABC transporter permease [Candidatus Merdisoma sp. JLR.KK006]|uniref:ABC transporter permease n=1 Tax=Candidatus Merdisoma sp. JLR.KK006 TaxID=3112626 RepID=UPI002FF22114